MNYLKRICTLALILLRTISLNSTPILAQDLSDGASNFYKSDKVSMKRVRFKNQYRMEVVGNLFTPKEARMTQKNPAIIVGHPMGAVKEQSTNLYASKLAERGFVTLSLDLSFWGESEGQPRHAVSPDIYAEDFSAALNFLSTQAIVDRDQIGVYRESVAVEALSLVRPRLTPA